MVLHTLNKNCDKLLGNIHRCIDSADHAVILIEAGTRALTNPLFLQLNCAKYLLTEHADAGELSAAETHNITSTDYRGWLTLSEAASATQSWY